jgi:hypothetical protein
MTAWARVFGYYALLIVSTKSTLTGHQYYSDDAGRQIVFSLSLSLSLSLFFFFFVVDSDRGVLLFIPFPLGRESFYLILRGEVIH